MADEIGVFLSYSHEDQELARKLARRLETAGYRIWIDEVDLRAGDSLIKAIATAIGDMEFLVALLTPASVESRWCRKELSLALVGGLNREGVKVLPIRVGEVPIPPELEDTYCLPLDPSDMEEAVAKLVTDIQSHNEERRRAQAAGEPLPTSGTVGPRAVEGTAVLRGAATMRAAGEVMHADDPVRIIGIVKEGVGSPRSDGTPGSALYRVPLRLSRTPSARWVELFLSCWDNPPSYSTMHRPGIASVEGNAVVLNGTTLDELETVHVSTLNLCMQQANEREAALVRRDRAQQARQEQIRKDHQRQIDEVASRIKFDGATSGLMIEGVRQVGWSLSEPTRTVNLEVTLRNAGPAVVPYWRADVRSVEREGLVGLGMMDPRNPGDAQARSEGGESIIEWQSTEPVPPSHKRLLRWKAKFRSGHEIEMSLIVSDDRNSERATINLSWPSEGPEIHTEML